MEMLPLTHSAAPLSTCEWVWLYLVGVGGITGCTYMSGCGIAC